MKGIANIFSGTGGQIDLLNTLYGGSVETTMDVAREEDRFVVTLSAPGMAADALNVLVEGNKLVLYKLLTGTTQLANSTTEESQRLAVPMFLRVMDIPGFVDDDEIEAVKEQGRVRVILPFKTEDKLHRRIDIKDLY
jgi:HSP20 family protein